MEPMKAKLLELIGDMSEAEWGEIMDFIGYLKLKRVKADSGEILEVIEDSERFWLDEK